MESSKQSQVFEIFERLENQIGEGDTKSLTYLAALKEEFRKHDRQNTSLQEEIEKYEEAYNKLTAPANRIGVFLSFNAENQALILLGEQEYVTLIDPKLEDIDSLKAGTRVKLNDAYAIIGTMPESALGNIVKVSQTLEDGRLRVGADAQNQLGKLILRSTNIQDLKIKVGDEVRLDPSGKIAVEHFLSQTSQDYFVEDIPETLWNQVGGQQDAISVIKETIELPLLYPEIYSKFDKKPAKGILLYGPPGCGKTLLGKAVAYNLAKDYSERTGKPTKECFLHISGPKILNMWLGETERMVREIFETAREKAKDGQLVVIFIDEAESILRTRSSGRWLNISNTVVPQFCAEMDGLVSMENIVVILTSNRPDYIDPAILRPERIDRKVRIKRPDLASSKEILSIYINENLPIDPDFVSDSDGKECARIALIEGTISHLFRKNKETEFLKVSYKSGESETLYWRDLISGALIKSVVDRAKDYAIKRAISAPKKDAGVNLTDLQLALKQEFSENEIFPKSDAVEDWLKLLDFDREDVISAKPIGYNQGEAFARKSII